MIQDLGIAIVLSAVVFVAVVAYRHSWHRCRRKIRSLPEFRGHRKIHR